jgi:hypothetical protein
MKIKTNLGKLKESPINRLHFEISWNFDGLYYPTEHWKDFGCVIIGWWINTIFQVMEGNYEGSFSFMDGPYTILFNYCPTEENFILRPKGIDLVFEVNIAEIIRELIDTINSVHQQLTLNGFENKEIFKKHLDFLYVSLSKLQKNND